MGYNSLSQIFDDSSGFPTMAFQVQIQNLGKLADATVRVGGLTVLAGVNNTGKSFFSKALYSILSAMGANLVWAGLNHRMNLLLTAWAKVERLPDSESRLPHLDGMSQAVAHMASVAFFSRERGVVGGNEPLPGLKEAVAEVEAAFALLRPELENWISERDSSSPFSSPDRSIPAHIELGIHAMRGASGTSRNTFSIEGLHQKLPEEFKGNFQVPRLSNLERCGDQGGDVRIGNAVSFLLFSNGGG